MEFILLLMMIFSACFVKAYAEQFGQDYYNKRKRTTKSPDKRSGSNHK